MTYHKRVLKLLVHHFETYYVQSLSEAGPTTHTSDSVPLVPRAVTQQVGLTNLNYPESTVDYRGSVKHIHIYICVNMYIYIYHGRTKNTKKKQQQHQRHLWGTACHLHIFSTHHRSAVARLIAASTTATSLSTLTAPKSASRVDCSTSRTLLVDQSPKEMPWTKDDGKFMMRNGETHVTWWNKVWERWWW